MLLIYSSAPVGYFPPPPTLRYQDYVGISFYTFKTQSFQTTLSCNFGLT